MPGEYLCIPYKNKRTRNLYNCDAKKTASNGSNGSRSSDRINERKKKKKNVVVAMMNCHFCNKAFRNEKALKIHLTKMKHWQIPEFRRESEESPASQQKQDTPSISSSNFRSPRKKSSTSNDSYKSLSSSSYRSDVSFKLWPDEDNHKKRKRSASNSPYQNNQHKRLK